jgi:hypothetical protein
MLERLVTRTIAVLVVLVSLALAYLSYTTLAAQRPEAVVKYEPPAPPPPESPLSMSADELNEYPLRLKVSALQRGGAFTAVIEGAARNERVWVLVGTRPGVSGCSGQFGTACEAIADFRVMGSVLADTAGVATWKGRVPRDHAGMLLVQAGVMRGPGGSESVLSNVDGGQVQ